MERPRLIDTMNKVLQSKFTFLLLSLIILLILAPLLSVNILFNWILNFAMLLVFISVIFAIPRSRGHLVLFIFLAVFSFIFNMIETVTHLPYAKVLSEILFVIFCLLATISFTIEILNSKIVTRDLIFGSLCVYLLIGIIFGVIYILIEYTHPGAFSYATADHLMKFTHQDFYYFSFMTLTTVGFGDIVAVSPFAKSIVMMESIIGIFYLATFVSRLISQK